jgi:exopolysaccharide production protein ExoQ
VKAKVTGNRTLIGLLTFLVCALLAVSSISFDRFMTLRPAVISPLVGPIPNNPLMRIFKVALIVIAALVILNHTRGALAVLRRVNRFFLAYMMLALLSVAWSAQPETTIARFVSTLAIVLVCLAFCLAGWHRRRFQNVTRPLLTVMLVASLAYIVLAPEYAADPEGAGYHGITAQKNPFGELCALGTLLWMHGWISGEAKAVKAIAGALLGWTLLWLSKSSTSLLATAFASWMILMILRTSPAIRRYTPYLVMSFAALVVAYALAVLNLVPGLTTLLLGPITAITGKDMTFTNRAMIWDIIKEHAQYHPILGTGYGAYWTDSGITSPSYVFWERMYFWPSEAHNGYLDVVNDLGAVGLICLLGFLAVYVRQSLQLFKIDRSQGTLYLALFFQQAMTNLSESCWFSPMGILPTVVVTLSTFALARDLIDQQRPGTIATVVKASIPRFNRMVVRR